jgi:hypothetical protein
MAASIDPVKSADPNRSVRSEIKRLIERIARQNPSVRTQKSPITSLGDKNAHGVGGGSIRLHSAMPLGAYLRRLLLGQSVGSLPGGITEACL